LKPEYVSNGGHRYYSEEQLKELIPKLDVKTDEQEMIDDILNIIHVFSCRINEKRSHINKKIMEKLKNESTD